MNNTSSAKQQIVEGIRDNTNILVTVSTDPSVDELSAALGLTAFLNKLGKHATAVVSGKLPPAVTFLRPDKTFESSADSLRDFIIALDKEKADHLRYKLEGDVVKIFITPYRTTLSSNDLEFSQGDYNVEMVVALNVDSEEHLDKALSAHGKILHDALVSTVTSGSITSTLGSVDWHDGEASSVSEMLVGLTESLKTAQAGLDEQISTALLTGIVASTERFSNHLTSSRVMTMAAQLMAAGANQQLISNHLAEAAETEQAARNESNNSSQGGSNKKKQAKKPAKKKGRAEDGALVISHEKEGDLDDVARQTQAENQAEAAREAESKMNAHKKAQEPAEPKDATLLTVPKDDEPSTDDNPSQDSTNDSSSSTPEDTNTDGADGNSAEAALAEATAPAQETTPPIHQELAEETAALTKPPQPQSQPQPQPQPDAPEPAPTPAPAASPVADLPPLPSIGPSQSSVRSDDGKAQMPNLGGTLNATTDKAAEDARREAERGQNKTILNHGGYVGDQQATFANTPLNGSLITDTPPKVDPFGASSPSSTPTLLDGSSVNTPDQAQATDARAAVDAALQAEPAPSTPAPAPQEQAAPQPSPEANQPAAPAPAPDQSSAATPPLPPLPPMPDFSTLPPLPTADGNMPNMPQNPADTAAAPQPQGAMPAAPAASQPAPSPAPASPGQFHIPGQ